MTYCPLLTVQQFAVKHRHAGHPADELEVGQVVLVTEARRRVNLQRVVVPVQRGGQNRHGSSTVGKLFFSGGLRMGGEKHRGRCEGTEGPLSFLTPRSTDTAMIQTWGYFWYCQ